MIIARYSTNRMGSGRKGRSIRHMLVLGCLFLLVACGPSIESVVQISGPTMGTSYMVKLVDADVDKALLQRDIDRRLIELNDVLSTYQPDSELSLLNASEASSAQPLSSELKKVLDLSLAVFDLSDGAFDVTVGPLVNLWGFGPDGPQAGVPAADAVERALAKTGFDRVTITQEGLAKPAGLYIDLSAIAKGYAVDEIVRLVESRGVVRYMVEIGGEVSARGQNASNRDWVIGLEAPDRQSRTLLRTLPLRNLGMATSGDYRNFFEHQGEVYSHTIDPATGWPVTHNQASVTVLHSNTAMADGLATAFSVIGPEKTMAMAEEMNLLVLAIIRSEAGYEEVLSPAMKQYLEN